MRSISPASIALALVVVAIIALIRWIF